MSNNSAPAIVLDEQPWTVGDIMRETGMASATVNKLIKDDGIMHVMTLMNGRVKLYKPADIRGALYRKHEAIIKFLGYAPLDQSYDVVTSA